MPNTSNDSPWPVALNQFDRADFLKIIYARRPALASRGIKIKINAGYWDWPEGVDPDYPTFEGEIKDWASKKDGHLMIKFPDSPNASKHDLFNLLKPEHNFMLISVDLAAVVDGKDSSDEDEVGWVLPGGGEEEELAGSVHTASYEEDDSAVDNSDTDSDTDSSDDDDDDDVYIPELVDVSDDEDEQEAAVADDATQGYPSGSEEKEDSSDVDEEAPITIEAHGKSWDILDPEGVYEDARSGLRQQPRTKVPADNTRNIAAIFHEAMPRAMVDTIIKFTNEKLTGMDDKTKKLTPGELTQFLGYMIALGVNTQKGVGEMWSITPTDFDVVPPPAMGRHGMSKNRFFHLRCMLRWYPAEKPFIEDDWWACNPLVTYFNAGINDVLEPGWLITPDETTIAWRGLAGLAYAPSRPPTICWIPRKPEPLCVELKTIADSLSTVMLKIEIQKGKEAHKLEKYFVEYGHTTACTLRLCEEWFGTGRVIYGDSWFASVKTAKALLERGLYFMGDIKTAHKFFPMRTLREMCGEERGAWFTITSTIDINGEDKFIGGVGHRRGGKVHTFVFTAGSTLAGNPLVYTFRDDEAGGPQVMERKCPRVLNDVTKGQPAVDKSNRYRQHYLALEKRFVTNEFPFRFFTYIIGQMATNAFFIEKLVNNNSAEFKLEMNKLGVALMHNDILASERGGPSGFNLSPRGRARAALNTSASSPSAHQLVPLRVIKGYQGAKQQRCIVCSMHTSYACVACTSAPHHVVALHPPTTGRPGKGQVKHGCFAAHKRAQHLASSDLGSACSGLNSTGGRKRPRAHAFQDL